MLDGAKNDGLISEANADTFSQAYMCAETALLTEDEVSNSDILVPQRVCLGDSGQHDRKWYDLLEELASRALRKWVLLKRSR